MNFSKFLFLGIIVIVEKLESKQIENKIFKDTKEY